MPATGKSTYLAAMSYILLSSEIDTILRWSQLDEFESHLYTLQDKWLKCEKLDHTPAGLDSWVTLHMTVGLNGTPIKVQLPDFSGESIKDAIVSGFYTEELYEALGKSSGIFLFTSADSKTSDILINEMSGIMSVEPESNNGPRKQFVPGDMPEQVKAVQLLQTIVDSKSKKRKLVVMISAWDIAQSANPDITPVKWLEDNRPLLHQYLEFNCELWESRMYGVSAQGGRLPADKARLNILAKPSERVNLVGKNTSQFDLTDPLYWLTLPQDS